MWVLPVFVLAACDCSSDTEGHDAGGEHRDAALLDAAPVDAAPLDAGAADTGDNADAAVHADEPPGPAPDLGSDVVTTRVFVDNARGERVDTVFVAPISEGPHPAVLIAHGSGGLFRMPGVGDLGTCSDRLESQFERWAKRLATMGFVVAMPDSFGTRGYCDFNDDPRKDDAYPTLPDDPDGKTRRLIDRIYDADAALRMLRARQDVRADRVALLGFSNGASTVMLYLHHRLPAAFDEYRASSEAEALGVSLPALPATAVPIAVGVAYYPGCGFDGLLPFTTDIARLDRFYYPRAPLRVNHAELDPLLDHCSITLTGTRERQADTYAAENGMPDRYDIGIHLGADHGFDSADCELMTGNPDPDVTACRQALPTTLDRLTPLLDP